MRKVLCILCVYRGSRRGRAGREHQGDAREALAAAASGQPKSGGTLTVAIEAEPPMMDPHLEQSNLVTSLIDLSFDFLWRWDRRLLLDLRRPRRDKLELG